MGESLLQTRRLEQVDAVLIAGPTASGKSALAVMLAEALGGVVINADSMQVYREVRVLSARPTEGDMARAPHLLYGHVGVREAYSVGRYQSDAIKAIGEARLPIFVGGTGLYFAALTEGLANIPPVPAPIRTAARERLAAIGVKRLHQELAARDPETAARLRDSDPQRVLRAYEVFEATGQPLSAWQKEAGKPVLAGLRLAKFVLDVERAQLRERIARRFDAMLAAGARQEAAALNGLDPSLPAAKILGLRELWAEANGTIGETEAVRLAVTATRQFAKRQSTWFRHRMSDWKWLNSGDISNNIAIMRQFLS
jgi:tRNA dimethylallyltransferase